MHGKLLSLILFVAAISASPFVDVPASLSSSTPVSQNELYWSGRIANGEVIPGIKGEAERILPDESRVDVYSESTVWEVEWSDKWEESIGQSLWYSIATGKSPGVILLLRGNYKTDFARCAAVCSKAGIRLETVDTRVR